MITLKFYHLKHVHIKNANDLILNINDNKLNNYIQTIKFSCPRQQKNSIKCQRSLQSSLYKTLNNNTIEQNNQSDNDFFLNFKNKQMSGLFMTGLFSI